MSWPALRPDRICAWRSVFRNVRLAVSVWTATRARARRRLASGRVRLGTTVRAASGTRLIVAVWTARLSGCCGLGFRRRTVH